MMWYVVICHVDIFKLETWLNLVYFSVLVNLYTHTHYTLHYTGIVDYSQQSLNNSSSVIDSLLSTAQSSAASGGRVQSVAGKSLYNDQDVLVSVLCSML